jgi:hypothetical protein
LFQAEPCSLLGQARAEVQMPRSRSSRGNAATQHDLRTHLIAGATDADTTMHYDIGPRSNSRPEALQPPPQDLTRRPPPAGVQQCDPSARSNQIYRHTVSDRHRQENSRGSGDPSVDPLYLDPAASRIDAHDLDAMDLVAEDDGVEGGHCSAERQPAAHHLTDRFLAPKAEIKPATGVCTSAGDPGDYAVALLPAGDLILGNGSRERCFAKLRQREGRMLCAPMYAPRFPASHPPRGHPPRFPAFTHPPARSRHRGHAAVRRCARTRARSGPRCESCWSPPPRERQGAWPSRRECRAIPPCRL